jgi:hypothetical protein
MIRLGTLSTVDNTRFAQALDLEIFIRLQVDDESRPNNKQEIKSSTSHAYVTHSVNPAWWLKSAQPKQ